MNEYQENREICHCKHVTFLDVERAMHDSKTFPEVEKTFEEVQKVTSCSTGCGRCHDEIMRAISDIMHA